MFKENQKDNHLVSGPLKKDTPAKVLYPPIPQHGNKFKRFRPTWNLNVEEPFPRIRNPLVGSTLVAAESKSCLTSTVVRPPWQRAKKGVLVFISLARGGFALCLDVSRSGRSVKCLLSGYGCSFLCFFNLYECCNCVLFLFVDSGRQAATRMGVYSDRWTQVFSETQGSLWTFYELGAALAHGAPAAS